MEKGQMKIEGTDTDLSLACDNYVEAKESFEKIKEEYDDAKDVMDCAGKHLAEIMIKSDMTTLKHAGYTIRAKEEKVTEANVVAKEE